MNELSAAAERRYSVSPRREGLLPNVEGSKTPLLGKGGVAAPPRNIAKHPLMGADGVVGSISPQLLMVREVVDRTTPSARNEVASQYLFERAATLP